MRFERCSEDFIAGHGRAFNHGAAFADPDHDGDTDIFWNIGGPPGRPGTEALSAFYVKQPPEPPNTVVVHPVGTVSNRDAIGTRIRAVGSETHYYTLHGPQGFQSQNSDWMVITLNDATSGTLFITWPSGTESIVEVTAGQRIEIVEPR